MKMAKKFVDIKFKLFIYIFLHLYLTTFTHTKTISVNPSLEARLENGNREKLVIELRKEHDKFDHPIKNEIAHKFRRFIRSAAPSPTRTPYNFSDSHYVAEVHWSGSSSSSIIVLMKDPVSRMSSSKPSYVYVSRNYGKTFQNITNNFTLYNGSIALISEFYSSKADYRKYIFVAKLHRYVFSSYDECRNIRRTRVNFYPNKVKYHPRFSYYVAAHEKDMGSKQLYCSTNNGGYWRYKSNRVKSFYWGYSLPSDRSSNIYYLKESWYNSKSPSYQGGYVYRESTYSYSWLSRRLASRVFNFELVDKYMFITRNNIDNRTMELFVSVNRGSFKNTSFPFKKNATSFIIADATENETMIAVGHGDVANLYISSADGTKYSLSLERILYYNKDDGRKHRYFDHDFIDLHRVEGISGIYIATQLTNEKPGKRHLKSYITFDKGGYWSFIKAPATEKNCSIYSGCSLHLSQEYGFHNPYTRFTPIFSKKSSPGFIIATGNVGDSLKTSPGVYFSRDAGLNWRKIFSGHYIYGFVDHGGIIVAVEKYGFVDTLQYSWDEGVTWSYYSFSKTPIRIYGLLTEPGEKTTIFTLFGSYSGQHSWILVQIDMKNVLGAPCKKYDYVEWQVSDQRNNSQLCLLGRRQVYERRREKSRCYNGYNYDRPIKINNCNCTREDYGCDYGFKESWVGWFETSCVPDSDYHDYSKQEPSWCRPGLTYKLSKGYRKVSGDSCVGGRSEQLYQSSLHACSVKKSTNFLIYAKRTSIYRYDFDTKETVTFNFNGMENVISLEMDYSRNIMFYADITVDCIMMLNLTGGNITTLIQFDESRVHIEALSYDWLAKNLYYCDAGSAQIGIINTEGKHRKILINSDVLGKPRAMIVHPSKGVMLWTDWGVTPQIARANMDGTGQTAIITKNIKWPNGLTVDYDSNQVFWVDAYVDRMESCNLDGTGRKLLRSDSVPHPYAITIYKSYAVWDDWNKRAIFRIDKSTGNNREYIIRYVYNGMDIKGFWPGRQKPVGNKCASSGCKFLCLPTSNGHVCSCPDNMIATKTSTQCKCPGNEKYVNGECVAGKGGSCTSSQFKCTDGDCIPKHWKCDKDRDCPDGSDELNCAKSSCRSDQFSCNNGRCILLSWKCDGDNDCGDRSDESGCGTKSCNATYQVSCPKPHARCISKTWLCDGEHDCADGWDEKPENCFNSTTRPTLKPCAEGFRCRNLLYGCLPIIMKCNGIDNCGDNSDEIGCSHITCQKGYFLCKNSSQCINNAYRCNDVDDCGDRSDEKNCPTIPPKTGTTSNCYKDGYAYCKDGKSCYPKVARCDKFYDCKDGSDEENCPKKTTPKPCYGFQCATGECIIKARRCDGIRDCRYGDDERNCPKKPKCLPAPFGFNCTIPGSNTCFEQYVRCNGVTDCSDSSDEDSNICGAVARVINLKASPRDSSVALTWEFPTKTFPLNVIKGLTITYRNDYDTVTSRQLDGLKLNYTAKNLLPCANYIFAVALVHSQVEKRHWLYEVTKAVETTGKGKPHGAYNINTFPNIILWDEDTSSCYDDTPPSSKYLNCGNKVYPINPFDHMLRNVDVLLSGKNSNFTSNAVYRCYIVITYGNAFKIKSKYFEYRISQSIPNPHSSTAAHGKKNTLIWAIPVSIVLVALLVGLVFMGYKYRRLQHNFLLFAARGNYSRQEDNDLDDEDNMAVGFRAGENTPMINRFSDDEPLVVA